MPEYSFRCSDPDCGNEFDETFSIKEELPTVCGHCEGTTLRVVPQPPIIIDRTPRTVGSLADRNSGAGRSYWLEDQRRRAAEDGERGRGEIRREAERETFWKGPGKVDTKIAGLSPTQKRNYILTGDSRKEG